MKVEHGPVRVGMTFGEVHQTRMNLARLETTDGTTIGYIRPEFALTVVKALNEKGDSR